MPEFPHGGWARARFHQSRYRIYSDKDIHILRFIRQARDLGFSIKQIDDLLSMLLDPSRPSSKVKSMAQAHIQSLDHKINDLLKMKTALQKLVDCCHGDSRPECPILDGMAETKTASFSASVNY